MKTKLDWDDLAYFAAIARTGALAKAAADTGSSVATLSRRMRAFETRTGRRLFHHGADGYALTDDGRALQEKARRMEAVAAEINQWSNAEDGPATVRISAGTWTALSLARGIHHYWNTDAIWLPEFIHSEQLQDIARRDIDIGIRNARPDSTRLAGQKVRDVTFAIYAAGPEISGWVTPSPRSAMTPSARWVLEHADKVATTANSPLVAFALAEAGLGRIVLPTFIGDTSAILSRQGDPIADLASEQWLVSHHEGRFEPAIRAALDALSQHLAATGVETAPPSP